MKWIQNVLYAWKILSFPRSPHVVRTWYVPDVPVKYRHDRSAGRGSHGSCCGGGATSRTRNTAEK